MEKMDYWGKIEKGSDFGLDFEPPEQKRLAGRLLILGGHANNFFSVARASQIASEAGVGEVLTVLPDSLAKKIPQTDSVKFLKSEKAGGFAKEGGTELGELIQGVDASLVMGDMGKNAEVKGLVADLLRVEDDRPMMLMRDAVDLAVESANFEQWLQRENAIAFVTIAQLKKILQAIYYPRVLNLTMPLLQIVEILHKFTLSYDVAVVTLQAEQIVLAQGGRILTVALADTKYSPMTLFDGELAVNMLRLRIWNKDLNKDLEAMAVACLN